LNASNGGSWNPKFTLKVNSFWIKIKGQNFASQVLSRHTFKNSRKKGSDFFDHRGTLSPLWLQPHSQGHLSFSLGTRLLWLLTSFPVDPALTTQYKRELRAHSCVSNIFKLKQRISSHVLEVFIRMSLFNSIKELSCTNSTRQFLFYESSDPIKVASPEVCWFWK